ncbi:MAG: PDZ domain-containing protein [Deltaproteobacteria bacterium]|nr:PDZ domain-containing protein [Deltaproteobacteria bacterium]
MLSNPVASANPKVGLCAVLLAALFGLGCPEEPGAGGDAGSAPDAATEQDAGSADGPASLRGEVVLQRDTFPPPPGDLAGPLLIAVMTEEQLANGEMPEHLVTLDADLALGPAHYEIGDLAPGRYYVMAMFDDNESFSPAHPAIDEGDIVTDMPRPVAIAAGQARQMDLLLNLVQGPAGPYCGAEPLDSDERHCVFDFLWSEADRYYPFFVYKSIDWDAVRERYEPLVEAAATDKEFHFLMMQLLAELRDGHSWIPKLLAYYTPHVVLDARLALVAGKVYVERVAAGSSSETAGLRVGDRIVSIEGETFIEFSNRYGKYIPRPNDHFYNYVLLSIWLASELDQAARVEVDRGGIPISLALPRISYASYQSPTVASSRLTGASGNDYGYIWIATFDPDLEDEILSRFNTALADLQDVSGLIIDTRENGGGALTLVNAVLSALVAEPAVAERQYLRGSSEYFETQLTPADNGFHGPVVALVDEGSYSGGNLVPSVLQHLGRATVLGRTGGGGFAGVESWLLTAQFVSRMGVWLIALDDGTIVELGVEPDVAVERTSADILAGKYAEPGNPERDIVLQRALELLGN